MFTYSELTQAAYDYLQQKNDAANARLAAGVVRGQVCLGYIQFAKDTRCFKRSTTVAAADGQALYAPPADLFDLYRVRYGAEVADLTPTSVRALDAFSGGGRAQTGTPTHWYPYDARQFGAWPAPAVSDPVDFTLEGYLVPYLDGDGAPLAGGVPLPVEDADTLALPDQICLAPVHWAVAQLASRYLADREAADKIVAAALTDYKRLVGEYNYSKF
ncbi:MAG: phage adaptor protein [Armatimonadota bacterium]